MDVDDESESKSDTFDTNVVRDLLLEHKETLKNLLLVASLFDLEEKEVTQERYPPSDVVQRSKKPSKWNAYIRCMAYEDFMQLVAETERY